MSEFQFIPETPRATFGLVDADSIMFNIGWGLAKTEAIPDAPYAEGAIPELIYTYVDEYTTQLCDQLGVTSLELHFTGSARNRDIVKASSALVQGVNELQFRTDLGEYKEGRSHVPPFAYAGVLRVLLEGYDSTIHFDCEADDWIVFRKKQEPSLIMSSNDKDVYMQVPGSNYCYDKRKKWTETSIDEANRFPYLQTIAGDPTDGFFGIKGKGMVAAQKAVQLGMTPYQMWNNVVLMYKQNHMTEEEAILNMRMANMHQLTEQGIELWTPPTEDTPHVYTPTAL